MARLQGDLPASVVVETAKLLIEALGLELPAPERPVAHRAPNPRKSSFAGDLGEPVSMDFDTGVSRVPTTFELPDEPYLPSFEPTALTPVASPVHRPKSIAPSTEPATRSPTVKRGTPPDPVAVPPRESVRVPPPEYSPLPAGNLSSEP